MAVTTLNRPEVSLKRLGLAGVVAISGSALVNAGLYLVASAAGAMPETALAQPMNQPITLVPVVSASIMGGLFGTVIYGLLARFTTKPKRNFYIAVGLALIATGLNALTVKDAPPSMLVVLNLMHLAAAAVTVVALLKLARPR